MATPDINKNKDFDIIINGTHHTVPNVEVSFDQVVEIAYPHGGRGPLITYTVNYFNGGGRPPEGKLTKGKDAKVKDGTVFNVTRTDRS